MGWDRALVPDPQDRATFERSKLRWDEPAEPAHARMLATYRELIALRRELPELTDPRLDRIDIELDTDARWLVQRRGAVTVVANRGDTELRLPGLAERGTIRFTTAPERIGSNGGELVAGGWSGAIVSERDTDR